MKVRAIEPRGIVCELVLLLGVLFCLTGCGGPQNLLLRGNLAYREGDLPGAAAFYKEALKSPETRISANFNLGRVFYDARDYKLALQHLDAGLSAEPEYLLGRFDRARTELALGDTATAAKDFTKCTQFDPPFAPAWLELAKIHASLGMLPQAVDEISHVLGDAALGEEASLLNAQWKVKLGNTVGAMKDLEIFLAARPDFAGAQFVLGQLLLGANDFREAERRFRSGLVFENSSLPGQLGLAQALEGAGRVSEAIAIYEGLLAQKTPESKEPEFEIAGRRLRSLREGKNVR